MAKAIFHQEFNYSSRVRNVGWSAKSSPKPQTFPREFVDKGVEAGVAEEVKPKRTKPLPGDEAET